MDLAPGQAFLNLIDERLDECATAISNKVFSEFREIKFTRDQYTALSPVVRRELDHLIWSILAFYDNVGGVLPDGIDGYQIRSTDTNLDIRSNYDDYSDMWLEYLMKKPGHNNLP